MEKWEHFTHDADIGIRGMGSTPAKAFEMAALALTAIVVDPSLVKQEILLHLEQEEQNMEFLFYEWINQIIYNMSAKKMLFGGFDITLTDTKFTATLKGQETQKLQHDLGVEVKGATFTELEIHEKEGVWVAQCVVDV